MISTNFFLIFRKCRKSSENTIRPSCNCFEWHTAMQYCPMANYHMYITYGKVFEGDSKHFYVLVISWKWKHFGATVNRALIVHTTLKHSALTKIYINFHFYHVPKLSIGFNNSYLRIILIDYQTHIQTNMMFLRHFTSHSYTHSCLFSS